MFENTESSLKIIAKINFICGAIGTVGLVLFGFTLYEFWPIVFIILGALFLFVTYFMSLGIYAFAEILQSVKETNNTLSIAYTKELSAYNTIMRQREELAARPEEKAIRAAAAVKLTTECYWASHLEEKSALLKKKRAAEEKLNKLDSSAVEEQKSIRSLIHSIDEELNKPR